MRILGTAAICFAAALAWTMSLETPVRAAAQAPAASGSEEIYKDVYAGWKWWHVYCYRCHGTDANGTTNAPNLTDPNEKMSRASFVRIVRDGVKDKGMQAWDKLLDAKQMGQLFVYVRARADKVLPAGRPDEVGPNNGPWEPGGWTPK